MIVPGVRYIFDTMNRRVHLVGGDGLAGSIITACVRIGIMQRISPAVTIPRIVSFHHIRPSPCPLSSNFHRRKNGDDWALAGAGDDLFGFGLKTEKDRLTIVIDGQVDRQGLPAYAVECAVMKPKGCEVVPISLGPCAVQKRCDCLRHVGCFSLPILHLPNLIERQLSGKAVRQLSVGKWALSADPDFPEKEGRLTQLASPGKGSRPNETIPEICSDWLFPTVER